MFLCELALKADEILNADCAITMLSERQVEEVGLRPGTEFGDVPDTRCEVVDAQESGHAIYHVAVSHADVQREIIPAGMGADARVGRKMFSTIVTHGKVIGVIRAYRPQHWHCFSTGDLHLFAILTLGLATVWRIP